jgi:hypothetical protein
MGKLTTEVFNESCCDGGEGKGQCVIPEEHKMGAQTIRNGFTVKDSGERAQFAGGMVRDVTTGKRDYSLVLDGPMFDRWAEHLTKGAAKYAKRNWMLAAGQEEYDRFRESALRHFLQWYRGEVDEDHASAVFFNINGAEYTKDRL